MYILRKVTGLLLGLNLIFGGLMQAGVVVLCDLPAEVSDLVKKEQDAIFEQIRLFNERNGTSYLFEPAGFDPHLSLSFISPEHLSVSQIKAQYPNLVKDLVSIAKQTSTINLKDSLKKAKLEYWQGKFVVNCGGTKKQNYVNVVLKLADNELLNKLAQQIQDLLKERYGIAQRFPFSAHITLGRICDQSDLVFNITDLVNEFMIDQAILQNLKTNLVIKDFKLKGHDQSEHNFNLKAARFSFFSSLIKFINRN